MKKNTLKKLAISFLFVIAALMSFSAKTEATSITYGDFRVKVISNKKCNTYISWKKRTKCDGYDILRCTIGKDWKKKSTWKKVGSVSGKTTKYTDKTTYGKIYQYEIMAYTKVNGKKHYIDSQDIAISAYFGYFESGYDDPQLELNITRDKIELDYSFCSYSGKDPKGYIIYRKTGNGAYKKIATTKKTKYVDKKVVPNTKYDYRIVAYTKVKGKKIYSAYEHEILTAMDKENTYKVECLTKPGVVDRAEYKISSDVTSPKLSFDTSFYGGESELYQYSYDGVNWIDVRRNSDELSQRREQKTVELEPGKSIYLAFHFFDGDRSISYDITKLDKWETYGDMNGYYSSLVIDFKNNTLEGSLTEDY